MINGCRNFFRAFLFLAVLLPLSSSAQNSPIGNWLVYIGSKKINTAWNLHHEIQYRNYNAIGDLEQLLLRTGIGYSFNNRNNNLLMGYGYILSENYLPNSASKISVHEHRVFQQFISKQRIGTVALQHRYRWEQRYREDRFRMRFRYFLSAQIPLVKSEEGHMYLSLYNEVFLNARVPVFDRNRLYGGLGYKVNKNVRIELGYMNQLYETNSRDQVNIIAFLTL